MSFIHDLNLDELYDKKQYNFVDKVDTTSKDIAIIGMALRFPLADTLDEFWENIRNGVDCVGKPSDERIKDIKSHLHASNRAESEIPLSQGAYIETIDKFDCQFFRIPPKEACVMSPAQRIFMETAWKAIEDAGYSRNAIAGSRTGVFLGYIGDIEGYKYKQIINASAEVFTPMVAFGNIPSMMPSRISYYLDLKGPSMLVDTACSSSLAAVHLACQSIRNDESDMALAGGVKINLIPLENSEKTGMESSNGRSMSFDDNGDGIGVGEGVACILLKPLDKAIKDKDNIYAVIKGSALNQDGNTIGITAPSVEQQKAVILEAWKKSGIDPRTIAYIEAHGSGTKIGDPIEIDAISRAFEKFTNKKQFCAISSVKSNIGHLHEASGIAGLIKAVLSLKNKELPRTIHFDKPNEKIEFEKTPVYINVRQKKWEANNTTRRCGVSSFGISGTNCHMIVEEAPKSSSDITLQQTTFNIFKLSGIEEGTIKRLVALYIDFLNSSNDINLENVCFTANTGRGDYPCRLIVLASSKGELLQKLMDFCFDTDEENGVFYNETKSFGKTTRRSEYKIVTGYKALKLINNEESIKNSLSDIAKAYVNGAEVDWVMLYKGTNYHRISLPTYPFQNKRCWVEYTQEQLAGYNVGNIGSFHKLIQETPENLEQHSYKGETDIENITLCLKDMFNKVLHIDKEKININEHVVEIGLDSVNLTQIKSAIQEKFGIEISMQMFFDNLTSINAIAEYIYKNSDNSSLLCSKIESKTEELNQMRPETYKIGINDKLELLLRDFANTENINMEKSKLQSIIDKQLQLISMQLEVFKEYCMLEQKSDYFKPVNKKDNEPCTAGIIENNNTINYQEIKQDEGSVGVSTNSTIPLTLEQKQIWFVSNLGNNESCAYNETVMLEFKGDFRPDNARNAIKLIIERHESLRTKISTDGEYQIVLPEANIEIPFMDYTDLNNEREKESEINEWLFLNSRKHFDLTFPPLFRANIIKLEEKRHILILSLHHIIASGWSLNVIFNEFIEIYYSEMSGVKPSLSKPVQFREYILWKDKQQSKQEKKEAILFWREKYSKSNLENKLELDFWNNYSNRTSFDGERQTRVIDSTLYAELKKFSTKLGCSLFISLLTSFKLLLHKMVSLKEIAVGIPVSGQVAMGAECLVGNCTSVLPVISHIDENTLVSDYLQNINKYVNDVIKYQAYSIADMEEDLVLKSIVPVTMVFNMNRPVTNLKFTDFTVNVLTYPISYTKYDLFFNAVVLDGELNLTIDYRTALYDRNLIDVWLDYYVQILKKIVENPMVAISELPYSFENVTQKQLLANRETVNEAGKKTCERNNKVTYSNEYSGIYSDWSNKLKSIFGEVLNIENINENDNFFEISGNSLKAIALLSRIHKELNVKVSLGDIFKYPTIKELSQHISKYKNSELLPIQKIRELDYYPLSSAQKRMFVLREIEGKDGISYNIPGVAMLEGKIDKDRLEYAIKALIKRHETLRTSFETIDGEVVQMIHGEVDFNVVYFVCENEKWEEIAGDFIEPFDLAVAPLFRVGIIQLAANKNILVIDMHHIIADGISGGILLKDFKNLYEGKSLPELRVQYKDFVAWQETLFKTNYYRKQEEYWLRTFAGGIPDVSMTCDYVRPAVRSFKGKRHIFSTSKELTQKLNYICAEKSVTLNIIVLAAFNVLLMKYTGQDDIVIGSLTGGRSHPNIENNIGMFVNTLAIRNYPREWKKFEEFLEEVQENTIKAYENQDYQFDSLVEKLEIERNASRHPIFQNLVVMQNMDDYAPYIGDLKFTSIDFDAGIVGFDLVMQGYLDNEVLSFKIDYCTLLYKNQTIEALSRQFLYILEQIADNQQLSLAEIQLMRENEKKSIIYDYNNIETDYQKSKTIYQIFAQQVTEFPDKIALSFNDSVMTYKELDSRVDKLAYVMSEKGIAHGDVVGLITDRSFNMIASIMGILKVGASYLPIDPEHPRERIISMLDDSKASAIITQDKYIDKNLFVTNNTFVENGDELPEPANRSIISLDQIDYAQEVTKPIKPSDEVSANDVAYIMYTSGTSGKPKANLIANYNITRVVKNTNYITINNNDRLLQLSNYAFDGSVFDIFGALLNGAELILIDNDTVLDMNKLSEVIMRMNVSVFFTTTALFNLMVDLNIDALKNVRKILFGGERVSINHVNKALKHLGKDRIIHVYGPTESTVFATYYPVNEIDCNTGTVPIGKPIANTKVYILDQKGNILPPGIPGELCISGDGLGLGYLNSEELEKSKFVPNPFIKGKRMYRTGDIAKYLPCLNIEYIGRKDNQVKIRGFRIELEEIEVLLLKHIHVKEAAAILKEEANGTSNLYVYFVSNELLDVSELKSYLSQSLPRQFIPSFFIQLEKMPLTSNKKIDRNALFKLNDRYANFASAPKVSFDEKNSLEKGQSGKESLDLASTQDEVLDKIEEKLLNIWKQVLCTDSIDINANFFDIGGNSILLIKMRDLIDKEYQKKVLVTDIFANASIKKLAKLIYYNLSSPAEAKSMLFDNIEIAPEYFLQAGEKNNKEVYSISISAKELDQLGYIANKENISISKVLYAVFVYLITQITDQSMITIQSLMNNSNEVKPISFDFKNISSFEDFIKMIKEGLESFELSNTYQINEITSGQVDQKNYSIVPFVYISALLNTRINLNDVYDLIMEINESEKGYELSFDFNSRRLRSIKIKKIVNGYLKLLKVLYDDYKEKV